LTGFRGIIVLVFGRGQFAHHARWFLLAVALTAAAVAWYVIEWTATGRMPGGASRVGMGLGVGGAAIILFEMLLWPRKRLLRFRTRPLGRTQAWMKAHIWLGLVCVPFAVLHSGFRLGGWLPTILMVVFAVVIVSGVWGLYLQHAIPRRLLDLVPDEVPAAEIERVLAGHLQEFARRLELDRGALGGEPVTGIEVVREVFEKSARAYAAGTACPGQFRSELRARRYFADLRETMPASVHPRVVELEALCSLRRQFDVQAQLHWRLHNWVWVHLPLSVLLVGLLVVHILTALRYQ
jgi:hypothetical protein